MGDKSTSETSQQSRRYEEGGERPHIEATTKSAYHAGDEVDFINERQESEGPYIIAALGPPGKCSLVHLDRKTPARDHPVSLRSLTPKRQTTVPQEEPEGGA